jgi:hypothetical protein
MPNIGVAIQVVHRCCGPNLIEQPLAFSEYCWQTRAIHGETLQLSTLACP